MSDYKFVRDVSNPAGLSVCADEREHGASHTFKISDSGDLVAILAYQKGPVGVVGRNGPNDADVLITLIDRAADFASKFPCEENATALTHLMSAYDAMLRRTQRRVEANVEGKEESA